MLARLLDRIVIAQSAHERASASYTFVPTERVLTGLMQAEFVPVEARRHTLG
jgi:hypothetical protein